MIRLFSLLYLSPNILLILLSLISSFIHVIISCHFFSSVSLYSHSIRPPFLLFYPRYHSLSFSFLPFPFTPISILPPLPLVIIPCNFFSPFSLPSRSFQSLLSCFSRRPCLPFTSYFPSLLCEVRALRRRIFHSMANNMRRLLTNTCQTTGSTQVLVPRRGLACMWVVR